MWGWKARSQDKPMTNSETLEKNTLQTPTIDPGVRIGHVHLKVADLQRALDFYCGVLGFQVTYQRPGAAFISAGGYHHHLGLNTWERRGGHRPRRLRGALPARPGRQRRRALLGPAEGQVAAEAGRLVADVHASARP